MNFIINTLLIPLFLGSNLIYNISFMENSLYKRIAHNCDFNLSDINNKKELQPTEIYKMAEGYVLNISVNTSLSMWGEERNSVASGFWLGGSSRLIVTNAHIASFQEMSQIYAIDAFGSKFKLRFIYANPLIDLAYLTPEDDLITQPKNMLTFDPIPELNSNVYMIGNNKGYGISFQDGRISDIYKIVCTDYPRKSIAVSINGKGGSSGSMVLNKYGDIVGINYSGSDVSNFIIPVEFLTEDIAYLQQKKIPPKFDIGLTFQHISESDARKYYNYSDGIMTEYNKQFPGAQSRLLQVTKTLLGTPGDLIFQTGDIITHIEDIAVGPDLFIYYNNLNNHPSDNIQITYYRNGQKKKISINVYDLNKENSHGMIVFGKAVLSCSHPINSYAFGTKIGQVTVSQNPSGNIFSGNVSTMFIQEKKIANFCIDLIDGKEIKDLDDVEKIIPILTKKGFFNYVYRNHVSFYSRPLTSIAEYNQEYYQEPVRMAFDFNQSKWIKKKIETKIIS